MTANDAVAAHTRDELGLTPRAVAQPVQAALASAATFAVGAAFPLIVSMIAPASAIAWTVSLACLGGLAALGSIGARVVGAEILRPTLRVVFWVPWPWSRQP